jgi:intron-binding protein aquarius
MPFSSRSRARLGLYIFGRVSLFRNCYELTPAFSQLCARPMQLHLAPWELFPTQRPWDAEPKNKPLIIEVGSKDRVESNRGGVE